MSRSFIIIAFTFTIIYCASVIGIVSSGCARRSSDSTESGSSESSESGEDAPKQNQTSATTTVQIAQLPIAVQQNDSDSNNPCQEMMESLGTKVIYDIERRKCVSAFNAECPENMEIHSMEHNATFGFCDCISARPTFYDASAKKCRLIYQQESCPNGQWLIYNNESQTICAENECEKLRTANTDEFVLYKGKCAKISGSSHPECEKPEILMFKPGEVEPECSSPSKWRVGASIPHLQCSVGSKWSHLTNNCQKEYHFTLS